MLMMIFCRTGKQGGAYVSPSDELMSPASAKLNAFKEKRFTKSALPSTSMHVLRLIYIRAKPRNLFGRSGLSSSTPLEGLDDDAAQEKEDDQKMSEG